MSGTKTRPENPMTTTAKKRKQFPNTPIGEMTSREVSERLQALDARAAVVKDRLFAIMGPTGPGAALPGAGAAYRAAVQSGSPGDLLALQEEARQIEAELYQLAIRREPITERQRAAEKEERRAAAPAELEKLVRYLGPLLEEEEKTRNAYATARASLQDWTRRAPQLRELLGRAQNHRLESLETTANVHDDSTGSVRRVPVLFGNTGAGMNLMDLLGLPDVGPFRTLIEKTRGLFGDGGNQRPDSELLRELRTVRYHMLAQGALDQVNDADALGRAAVLAGAPSERGRRRLQDALS